MIKIFKTVLKEAPSVPLHGKFVERQAATKNRVIVDQVCNQGLRNALALFL
jgi:hypothetical protein